MRRLDCVCSQSNLTIPTKIHIYSTCIISPWFRNLDSYTNRLEKTGLLSYAVSAYTSAGMTLSPMTKFYAVVDNSRSHSLSENDNSVYSATLPDSHTPYQPIRSLESVPRREMASDHHRNGGVPAICHPPPGFTRSAVTHTGHSDRGPAAGGG